MSTGDLPPGITAARIERALGGDGAALRALIKAITPSIHHTVARVCSPSRNDVEDLVQEVLLLLLEDNGRRLRLWDPRRGTAYLRKIAWNCAVAQLRNRSRHPPPRNLFAPEQLDQLPGRERDPEGDLLRARYRAAVLVGLELELSDHEAAIFALLLEGVSARDICERTGTPTENAVHLVRQRIVAKARAVARKLTGEAGD
jgi:RNA polymerase sigma factor (sigma-70 family)